MRHPIRPPRPRQRILQRSQRHPRPEPEARDDHRTTLHCRIGSAARQPRLRPMAAGSDSSIFRQIAAMPGRPVQHQRLGLDRHRIQDQPAARRHDLPQPRQQRLRRPAADKDRIRHRQPRQPLRRARLGHPVAMRQPEGLRHSPAPAPPAPGQPPAPRPARPRPAATRSRSTRTPRRCPTAPRPGAGPAPTASTPAPGAW